MTLKSFFMRWGLPLGLIVVALICAGLAWQATGKASVVVEWRTASEVNAVGFQLYRNESPSGPEERITTNLIPVKGDSLTGADYQYTDTTVRAGRTYDYWLEEIGTNGSATRHGPITVQAQSGGLLEGIVALAFLLLAGVAIWLQLRKKSTTHVNS
jgi:hypothetical protein